MAAKLLQSLADENPDLQKQIGCMTGIFQLFDRHHALTARRIAHKRLPSGILLIGTYSMLLIQLCFFVSSLCFYHLAISDMINHSIS